MSKDFKTTQLRVNKIINSNVSSDPFLLYGQGSAADDSGGIVSSHFAGTGSDVWMFISGASGSADISGSRGAVAFKGDVVVSGALQVGDPATAPGTPASGKGTIFARTGSLYFKNSSGSEYDLTAGGSAAGGSDKQVQFNDGGALGGDAQFTYDKTSDFLSLTGSFAQGGTGVAGPKASGSFSHAEGRATNASGSYSHAEGWSTVASGSYSHAEGVATVASGLYSHAEGNDSDATGEGSHSEGDRSLASGAYSHSEGILTTASGDYSHAEGDSTVALGTSAHAEGVSTQAKGAYSHAEGANSATWGIGSHAEGYQTVTSGSYSHAEGYSSTTYGDYSHAAGNSTVASGSYSYAGGQGTITSGSYQHVIGLYNKRNDSASLFIIGNGSGDSDANRSDVLRVKQGTINDGRVEITGSVAATTGYTGSLTKLTDGSNYLLAGSSITLTTGSNGSVTIAASVSDAVAGSNTLVQFNDNGVFGAKSTFTFATGSDLLSVPQLSASLGITGSNVYVASLSSDQVVFAGANGKLSGSSDMTYNVGTSVLSVGSSTFGANVTIVGDLTVNGTTTTVNTDNLLVKDALIVIGSGSTGPNANGALAIFSGSSGAGGSDLVIGRIDNDTWGVGSLDTYNGTRLPSQIPNMSLVNMRAAQFQVNGTTTVIKGSGSELIASGSTVSISGSTISLVKDGIQVAYVGIVNGTLGFFPGLDLTYNLGSQALRWNHIYTGDLHLRNERGDYTLIEEEEFLTIRFNKTGKRYKFVLEPVPELDEK